MTAAAGATSRSGARAHTQSRKHCKLWMQWAQSTGIAVLRGRHGVSGHHYQRTPVRPSRDLGRACRPPPPPGAERAPRGHDVLWITSWWSQPPFQSQRRRGRSRGLRVDGAAHSQRCSRLTARTRHHGPRHSSSWPWPWRSRSPWWSRCSFSKTTSSCVVPFCRRYSEPKPKLLPTFRSSGRHINFQYFCFAQKNSIL